MKILAVETATALQSAALLDGSSVVLAGTAGAAQSHARHLIPLIDRLFQTSGWTLSHLDGLAVSIGPGSFTGLRVGLATMLGFRSVRGLPLVAVPTLEGLCWNVHMADGDLCPVIRSRPGEVYWARYRWIGPGQLDRHGDEQVGSVETLARSIEGPTILIGDGWELNRDQVRRLLGEHSARAIEGPAEKMAASAVSVGLAGVALLRQGHVAGNTIAPRYVQRAEAEIVWDRRTSTESKLKA